MPTDSIANSPPRTWAEIDLQALSHNLKIARKSSDQAVMAVLKAGAYGHDIKHIARVLEEEKLAFFGVASVIEARRIASTGCKTRLYLLGPTLADECSEIVHNRWVPSISSLKDAQYFNELNATTGNSPLPIHITVDTGMGRGGFLPSTLAEQFSEILKLEHIIVEGIGSHLPSADEDKEFTLKQFQNFEEIVKQCDYDFKYIHLAVKACDDSEV